MSRVTSRRLCIELGVEATTTLSMGISCASASRYSHTSGILAFAITLMLSALYAAKISMRRLSMGRSSSRTMGFGTGTPSSARRDPLLRRLWRSALFVFFLGCFCACFVRFLFFLGVLSAQRASVSLVVFCLLR